MLQQHRSAVRGLHSATESPSACVLHRVPFNSITQSSRLHNAALDRLTSSSSSAAAAVPAVSCSRCSAIRHHARRLVSTAAAAVEASAPPPEAAYRPPEPHKLVMDVAGQQVGNHMCMRHTELDQPVRNSSSVISSVYHAAHYTYARSAGQQAQCTMTGTTPITELSRSCATCFRRCLCSDHICTAAVCHASAHKQQWLHGACVRMCADHPHSRGDWQAGERSCLG